MPRCQGLVQIRLSIAWPSTHTSTFYISRVSLSILRTCYPSQDHVYSASAQDNPHHLPPSSSPTMADDRIGFKWGDNDRSTLTLVWTCFATIFACTFTVVHLNCPRIGESSKMITRKRLTWFLQTLLVPEYTLSVAIGQYNECTEINELMTTLGYTDWTRTHSFYLFMGGYKLQDHAGKVCRLNKWWIKRLHKADVQPWFRMPELSRQEIEDHGRADSLGKAIVCAQVGWMIIQSVARVAERLPISQLEIMTLAYVAIALLSNYFWWEKPFDARVPIIIPFEIEKYIDEGEMYSWSKRKQNIEEAGLWDDIDDSESSKMHSLHLATESLNFSVAGAFFGSIHCMGWNFSHASHAEQFIWRSCSVFITVVPAVVRSLKSVWCWTGCLSMDWWLFSALGPYLVARITLIFQTLLCLRSMPAAIYTSAAWVNYIPHFG